MGLILLTKDDILSDFLLLDCPLLTGVAEDAALLRRDDLCVVDAETIPAPYPDATCLLIARKKQETQLRTLLRPLAAGALSEALGEKDAFFAPYLIKEKRALVTAGGTLSFPTLEFALLAMLFENRGQTVGREALCQALRSVGDDSSRAADADGLLTVYIYRLRKKLTPLSITLTSHRKNGYSLKF